MFRRKIRDGSEDQKSKPVPKGQHVAMVEGEETGIHDDVDRRFPQSPEEQDAAYEEGLRRLKKLGEILVAIVRQHQPDMPEFVIYEAMRQAVRDWDNRQDDEWPDESEQDEGAF